jgi:3-hydroxyisobutyrate dehydrogenase/glyoxylate/succinic semialdehyde reductase
LCKISIISEIIGRDERVKMNIGFLGLGIMGSRMAMNLLKAGHTLHVWNRSRGKDTALVEAGAHRATSPAQAANEVDVVVTMLSTPEVVEETALMAQGFLAALPPGALWIDSSTVNPSFSRRMADECAARGLRMLDAPVTGSKAAAESGQLVFLVGGSTEDVESARPLFNLMGKAVVHVGENGQGSALKIVNNMLAAQAALAFAETLALGEAQGISRHMLMDFFFNGMIAAPLLKGKRAFYESGDFGNADFPLQWMQKDLHLAALTAYEVGAAIPSGNLAKEMFRMAIRAGMGEDDFTAVFNLLSRRLEG